MPDTRNDDRPVPPADTHRELMEAGYAALVEHGYADLSMRKIAAKAGRSHSLLQHYYGTKKGVVVELLSYLIDGYLQDVETAEAAGPVEQLRLDVDRALTGPADEDTERFWAFQTALFELRLEAREDEDIHAQFRAGERRVTEQFADSVRAGVDAGVFHPVDPEAVALLLRDLVDAARFRRVVMNERDAPERMRRAVDQFVVASLRTDD
jgi:AcrR family transcriptional regulator